MEEAEKRKIKEELKALQKAIGERVRKMRKTRGMSQEAFQEFCGIGGRAQMSNIERGKQNLTLETLGKLARKGFGMTRAQFLKGLEKDPKHKGRLE